MVKRKEPYLFEILKELDIILMIQKKLVTGIEQLDVGCHWPERVEMTILRDKQVIDVQVPTFVMDGSGTRRVLFWSGAVIQGEYIRELIV
jgi:hypothetical protein